MTGDRNTNFAGTWDKSDGSVVVISADTTQEDAWTYTIDGVPGAPFLADGWHLNFGDGDFYGIYDQSSGGRQMVSSSTSNG